MSKYEETAPKTEDNAAAMAGVWSAMDLYLDVTIVASGEERGARFHR